MKRFPVLHHCLILVMAVALSACNGIGTAKIDGLGGITGTDGGGTISAFAGISSVDLKTDSTVRLNWSAHADAVAYDVFNVTSGPSVWFMTVNGQASTSVSLTGLTPNQLYKFRVRAKDSAGLNDSNTNDTSVMMNMAPDIPSGLTLITPATSPDTNATPTIRVSGVKNGDTVKLFSDNTCTTQLATGTATGTTIDLTTSTLATATYSIYTNASNSVPASSTCSTASVTYQKQLACPTNYIPVAANPTVGTTSEFCVMKFEAKSVGGIATSQAASAPWVNIDQINSKTACTALGAGYDLVSNPEWMTIAYDIEATASNWDGGVVGTGALFRGHTDDAPASALAVTNTADPYDGTGNTAVQAMGSGREQKRTFTLSNGEEIWDLAGNVWEWTDWSLGGALASGPTSCNYGFTELPSVSCGALSAADYMPGNPAGVIAANYKASYGLGRLCGGTGGAAMRGGALNAWSGGENSGAFSLNLSSGPTASAFVIGFRCVYRP